jgi:uncharacterized protein
VAAIAQAAAHSGGWAIPWPCAHEFVAVVTGRTFGATRTPLPVAFDALARIAAICLEHSVEELWTSDRDFARFPDLRIRDPLIPSIHDPLAQVYGSAASRRRRSPPTADRLRG